MPLLKAVEGQLYSSIFNYIQGMSSDLWICQHKILENIQNLLTDTLNSSLSMMLYI